MTLATRIAISEKAVELFVGFQPGTKVQTDPNAPFEPPTDALWGRVTFTDGNERRFPGKVNQLVRKPVLAFIDAFAPSGAGDGLAVDAIEAQRVGLRDHGFPGVRFMNFREGPEGSTEGYYRKQLIAVFRQSFRV